MRRPATLAVAPVISVLYEYNHSLDINMVRERGTNKHRREKKGIVSRQQMEVKKGECVQDRSFRYRT